MQTMFWCRNWCTKSHLVKGLRLGRPEVRGPEGTQDGGTPQAKHEGKMGPTQPPKMAPKLRVVHRSSGLQIQPIAAAQAVRRSPERKKPTNNSRRDKDRSHLAFVLRLGPSVLCPFRSPDSWAGGPVLPRKPRDLIDQPIHFPLGGSLTHARQPSGNVRGIPFPLGAYTEARLNCARF